MKIRRIQPADDARVAENEDGIAQKLLDTALEFAGRHYSQCYLETRHNMDRAKKFYEKNGFTYTAETIGSTGHGGCDYHYIKDL